VIGQISVK